ncbi:tRNA-dihydrouridine synthase A [Zancudomyces culisetae]|uniref:tRNA-dihydrouridine synthase A n=1 Tax=Zancudomyces culisetae TaxID=1213189 RepID=A0A1R1PNU4_ZANCU|nr:tRNA-dihydrouridine synthase A [Zancudomyces culisetae]|eukprot:OMH82639.1 tRNA-dihydrouridine synthase A [Zancudomyces culisetae]
MKTPEKVGDICKAMKEAAGDSAEISVKFRVGVDEEENLDFISRFLDMVSTKSSVTKYVLHARRAWLKGLSPKQNRTVPPLNYDLVYETVKKYPEFVFIGNGGVETTEGVVEKLEKLDGVMIGRKIMHDPWFLQVLDREIYGIDESLVPTEEQVMSRYLDYADMLQKTVGTKNTILAKPMFLIYKGNKGRFFRGQLGQLISKVSGKRYVAGGIDKGDSLWGAESEIHGHPLFSTLVNETLHLCNKQFEHIKARKETSAGITSIH